MWGILYPSLIVNHGFSSWGMISFYSIHALIGLFSILLCVLQVVVIYGVIVLVLLFHSLCLHTSAWLVVEVELVFLGFIVASCLHGNQLPHIFILFLWKSVGKSYSWSRKSLDTNPTFLIQKWEVMVSIGSQTQVI